MNKVFSYIILSAFSLLTLNSVHSSKLTINEKAEKFDELTKVFNSFQQQKAERVEKTQAQNNSNINDEANWNTIKQFCETSQESKQTFDDNMEYFSQLDNITWIIELTNNILELLRNSYEYDSIEADFKNLLKNIKSTSEVTHAMVAANYVYNVILTYIVNNLISLPQSQALTETQINGIFENLKSVIPSFIEENTRNAIRNIIDTILKKLLESERAKLIPSSIFFICCQTFNSIIVTINSMQELLTSLKADYQVRGN